MLTRIRMSIAISKTNSGNVTMAPSSVGLVSCLSLAYQRLNAIRFLGGQSPIVQ